MLDVAAPLGAVCFQERKERKYFKSSIKTDIMVKEY